MKLLPPQQIHSSQQDQITRELVRIEELNKATLTARQNLANAMADFDTALAKNQELWAKDQEAHLVNVREKQEELEVLEKRKVKALEPLKFKEQQLDARERDLAQAFDNVLRRTEEVEDLQERLEDRLDALGTREQDVYEREVHVALQEDGLERQTKEAHTRAQALTNAMNKFVLDMEKAHKDLEKRKTVITLAELSNIAKHEQLEKTQLELAKVAKRLADQRGTLERAMKRISPYK